MVNRRRKDASDAVWAKCNGCGDIIYYGELNRNIQICPKCNYYFPLVTLERMTLLSDNGRINGYNSDDVKIGHANLDLHEVILTGEIRLSGHCMVAAAINMEFQTEAQEVKSILPIVYSKLIEAMSIAIAQKLPFLLCINSSEQFSNAWVANIGAAISRLNKEKLLFISLLAQSDTECNFPGFAYLADIVIAESNVSLDMHTNLKPGKNASSQGSLGLLHNGLVDMIVARREMKNFLANIIKFFC